MISFILCTVCSYFFVALCLTFRRIFKLLDLYEAYLLARAREQKIHTRAYANMIKSGFVDDLIWPKNIFKELQAVYAWLKS
jgi:hypothetical protein